MTVAAITTKSYTIPAAVIPVLEGAVTDGNSLKLVGKLDRPLYVETNKVLEALGGKWNRKAGAHIFEGLAADLVDEVLLTGCYSKTKQDFGFFETPDHVIRTMIDRAGLDSTEEDPRKRPKVLEPSAGTGRIVRAAQLAGGVVWAYEVQEKNALKVDAILYPEGVCNRADFLTVDPAPVFDVVLMNPPFARRMDAKHINHAWRFVKPAGGVLVAIASAGVKYRQDQDSRILRATVEGYGGTIEDLPEGTFKESGTMVQTVMITMETAR